MITFTPTEGVLVMLSGVIMALFVVTVVFSTYAIVLRFRHARRDRVWTALTNRWEGPVLAAIVDPERVSEVHDAVPEEYRLHFVNFVLEYTRRVRGEERNTLRTLAEPYLDAIAERTKHRDAGLRTRAVQTLGTLGLPAYSEQVLEGLNDESPLVSMVAARYLAREEFPQFAPAVLQHLDKFDGWNRRFLASMLAAIGPESSDTLRLGLTAEETPEWLRAVYAEALMMQRDPLSGDLAAAALAEEPGRELVASLLRLLAEVGRPDHLPIVRKLAKSDDVIVRALALHALGLLTDGPDVPALVEAMADPSPWAAMHAARGVREAGGRMLLEDMVEQGHPHAELAGQVLNEEADA